MISRRSLPLLAIYFLCVAPAGAAGPTVRVLTYNIHHGEGTDSQFDLPRLAKVITDSRADLVSLQEVDRKTRRAGGVDQAAELAKLTGLELAFSKALSFEGGEYGNAILSRFPIDQQQTIALPHSPGSERRAVAVAQVRLKGIDQDILFLATHLDHMAEKDRLDQVAVINRYAAAVTLPAILAGDLNDEPNSQVIGRLGKHFEDTAPAAAGATWPSKAPSIRIDYVLQLRPARWRVVESRVIDERVASDHRPLLVVLEWTGEPESPAPAKPAADGAKP